MDIYGILTMIGGLVLFLYGISTLGTGLKKVSGGRLEVILESLTSNKWKAAAIGAGVTALIQSSGATTVMVVGFVNSEIMTLAQGAGIILGANVGTTITAWLLSLTGISGQNFLLSMLKPKNFAPLVGLIGIVMSMFGKKDRQKDVGGILTSFAVLLIGMTMMADSASPLADDPNFTSILTMFSNPILGVLVGLGITGILQSSSASIGILQAISTTGTLSYAEMIPLLMGMNIGSAITCLISAVGASRNGRRAAWMQMLFCILKVVLFMVPFYIIHGVVDFAFMHHATAPINIAMWHTTFNLISVLVALPLSDYLVALTMRLLPVTQEEEAAGESRKALQILDERFLSSPSFALEQCRVVTNEMARYTREAFVTAASLVTDYTPEKAARVDQLERTVDEYEDKLDSYLVKLSGRTYSRKDSHMLSTLLHCISDFERITDHALNVMQIAGEMNGKEQNFSAKAQEELRVFSDAVTDIIDRAVEAFKNYDLKMAKTIEPLEEVIDGINMEIKRRHVRRLRKGKCTIELGFSLTDITTNYERIADHCSNIAVCLLQVNEDGFDTHEYLERVWNKDDEEFRKMAEDYEAQYTLPGSKTDDLPVILEGKELAEAMVRTPEETAAVQAALEEVAEETAAAPKKKKKDKEKEKEKEKAEKAAKKAEKKAKKEKKMLEESLTEEGPA